MPNVPEDREEFPADPGDEDRNREGQREDVPGSGTDDKKDDREREVLQMRARLDPTRYVL